MSALVLHGAVHGRPHRLREATGEWVGGFSVNLSSTEDGVAGNANDAEQVPTWYHGRGICHD